MCSEGATLLSQSMGYVDVQVAGTEGSRDWEGRFGARETWGQGACCQKRAVCVSHSDLWYFRIISGPVIISQTSHRNLLVTVEWTGLRLNNHSGGVVWCGVWWVQVRQGVNSFVQRHGLVRFP